MVRGVPRNQAELSRPIEEVSIGDILGGRGGRKGVNIFFLFYLHPCLQLQYIVIKLLLLTCTVKGRIQPVHPPQAICDTRLESSRKLKNVS